MDRIIFEVEFLGEKMPEGWKRDVVKNEAGLVTIRYTADDGEVRQATFSNPKPSTK